MTTIIVLGIIGLVMLVAGGEFLVTGASGLARKLRMSSLLIGLTIVAFGTSAPELFISVRSAFMDSPDLVMGNIIGSNICNLALVLGITALIGSIKITKEVVTVNWTMTMAISILLFYVIQDGIISSSEGILFVTILVSYLVFLFVRSRKNNGQEKLEGEKPVFTTKSWARDIGFLIVGIALLSYGSKFLVESASSLAEIMGVSQRVIAIVVIAVGTSLPELFTSIIAAMKKDTDLALGNLLGSNIFNILSILGITSIIQDINIAAPFQTEDMYWVLGITAVLLPMMFIGRKISRIDGFVLFCLYVGYIVLVIMEA